MVTQNKPKIKIRTVKVGNNIIKVKSVFEDKISLEKALTNIVARRLSTGNNYFKE